MINALYYQLKTSSAVNLQYRAANLIWLIGAVLEPVIYLAVWDTVAKAQGGSVEGFTTSDFAAYFIALMVVDRLTFTWIMWEYEFMIREGTLARRLMRPLHPGQHHLQIPSRAEHFRRVAGLHKSVDIPLRELPTLDRHPALLIEDRRNLPQRMTVGT